MILLLHLTGARKVLEFCVVLLPSWELQIFFFYFLCLFFYCKIVFSLLEFPAYMVTCKPGYSWLLPNLLISCWRSPEQIAVRGCWWAAHTFGLLPLWIYVSSIPWCPKKVRLFLLWIRLFFFLWDIQFLGKLSHVAMHLSSVFLFWIKISSSEIKDNFSSSEKKVALPFYFLLCLFCCQLSLKMAFFDKARILLNELVLILCLVYLHKWNMKGGEHWSEKITRDQKQTSMKKNVKSGRGTHHTRFSPSAAGWPLKILRWTCQGARPRGSPCSNPCGPPGSTLGILSEIYRLQCRKFAMSGWRGWMRPHRFQPELCESRTGTKRHTCFRLCSWTGCWRSWISFRGASRQLPFHAPPWDRESYKSLDHFIQVLILQPAASQKVIN